MHRNLGEGIVDKIVTGFLFTIPELKEKLEGGKYND